MLIMHGLFGIKAQGGMSELFITKSDLVNLVSLSLRDILGLKVSE